MSSRLFGHCRIHVFGIAERKAIICCYRALRTNILFSGPSQNPSCFHVGIFLFVVMLALFCRKNVFFFILSSFVAGLKSAKLWEQTITSQPMKVLYQKLGIITRLSLKKGIQSRIVLHIDQFEVSAFRNVAFNSMSRNALVKNCQ